MHIAKWKMLVWKATFYMISTMWYSGKVKKKIIKAVKKIWSPVIEDKKEGINKYVKHRKYFWSETILMIL